jgi:hypothetical protein
MGGADGHPRVLVRERVEMMDAHAPQSKQPYHAVEGLPIEKAAKRLADYQATAVTMAHEGIQRIVDELGRGGQKVIGVGILESAGRKGSSLAATLASHALIHAADGDHFRNAIAAAATRCELAVWRVRARELDAEASAAIGQAPETLREVLKEMGREMGPPWGADQKAAALLAWLILARGLE